MHSWILYCVRWLGLMLRTAGKSRYHLVRFITTVVIFIARERGDGLISLPVRINLWSIRAWRL
jgi:hypothetical protein